MGYTTGQPAHGFHFLGLYELRLELFMIGFGLLSFCNVPDKHQSTFFAFKNDRLTIGFHPHFTPIQPQIFLLQMVPYWLSFLI